MRTILGVGCCLVVLGWSASRGQETPPLEAGVDQKIEEYQKANPGILDAVQDGQAVQPVSAQPPKKVPSDPGAKKVPPSGPDVKQVPPSDGVAKDKDKATELPQPKKVPDEPPPCPPTSKPGCYAERCRTVNRTILNACLTETKCVKVVPVKKGYTAKTKDVPTEVPCTRMVAVPVQDQCTGQTHIEMRPQVVMQKATTTYIVVLPPEGPDTTRKEVQRKLTLKVAIGHAPAEVVEKVPVPCGKHAHH